MPAPVGGRPRPSRGRRLRPRRRPPGWQPPVEPVETKTGPGLLVRAVWFVFVGWWLSAIVSAIAWVALVTIIGIPLGIWLINRIPTVITLRPRTRELQAVAARRQLHGHCACASVARGIAQGLLRDAEEAE
jgi:hypothetical protein